MAFSSTCPWCGSRRLNRPTRRGTLGGLGPGFTVAALVLGGAALAAGAAWLFYHMAANAERAAKKDSEVGGRGPQPRTGDAEQSAREAPRPVQATKFDRQDFEATFGWLVTRFGELHRFKSGGNQKGYRERRIALLRDLAKPEGTTVRWRLPVASVTPDLIQVERFLKYPPNRSWEAWLAAVEQDQMTMTVLLYCSPGDRGLRTPGASVRMEALEGIFAGVPVRTERDRGLAQRLTRGDTVLVTGRLQRVTPDPDRMLSAGKHRAPAVSFYITGARLAD